MVRGLPLSFYYYYHLPVTINGAKAPARLLIGMVCTHTRPGPVTTVLKIPSPPKSIFLTPGTFSMLMLQVALMAAR